MTKRVHVAIRIILQVQNPRGCTLISSALSPSNREIYIHRADWPHVPLVFFMEPVNYVPGLLLCSIPYRYRPRHISSGTASFPHRFYRPESDVAYVLRKYGGTYVWLYRGDRLFCHRLFFVVDHSAVGDPCSTINFSYVEAY